MKHRRTWLLIGLCFALLFPLGTEVGANDFVAGKYNDMCIRRVDAIVPVL